MCHLAGAGTKSALEQSKTIGSKNEKFHDNKKDRKRKGRGWENRFNGIYKVVSKNSGIEGQAYVIHQRMWERALQCLKFSIIFSL